MPITANSRRMVASSAAVPRRMAPWRSMSRRWISPVRCRCCARLGSAASTQRLVSATSSISAPYRGTSSRYMSDMALEKPLRMSSGLINAVVGIEKFLAAVRVMNAVIPILLGAAGPRKRRFLWTSFCKRMSGVKPSSCASERGWVLHWLTRWLREDWMSATIVQTTEGQRLAAETAECWRDWGPYLSERQWGTVREDYSADGDAWRYFPHEHARSRAYRWGEDGLAGFSDKAQRWCMGLALWNERDAILKERLFGLNNAEGNHGEDVKELYFFVDGVPSHAYMRMLYKYPHAAFPYADLIAENARRGLADAEYEILDTGVFEDNRYCDVSVEYAKHQPDDIFMRVSVHNRLDQPTRLQVLPQVWARNDWSWRVIMNCRIATSAPGARTVWNGCSAKTKATSPSSTGNRRRDRSRMGSTITWWRGRKPRFAATPAPRRRRVSSWNWRAWSAKTSICVLRPRTRLRSMRASCLNSAARRPMTFTPRCSRASPMRMRAMCNARPWPVCCGPSSSITSTLTSGSTATRPNLRRRPSACNGAIAIGGTCPTSTSSPCPTPGNTRGTPPGTRVFRRWPLR